MKAQAWSSLVKLDTDDRARAERCAEDWMARGRRGGLGDRFGDRNRDSNRSGALGEIAFAKFMNVPWVCPALQRRGQTDVAGYEVRAIPSDQKWVYLKSKETDLPESPVVLVLLLHHDTAALIVGWLYAREIRAMGQKRDPGNRGAEAWFVEDLTLLRNVSRQPPVTP